MNVGLEAIAFHTTRYYVDLAELANARGIAPEKFTEGLGQKKMAIATPPEDTVYLAINAGLKALSRFGIEAQDIGTLVVGTETGIDHSKPVAVYVHQALGLSSNCITYETKHACFGATAAISSAGDWLISGRARGKKALIIAADIASYGINTAGEPTQGAGAVAMIISDQPRLMEFVQGINSTFTKNVMDFWRPLYSKEAVTDGHYSIRCYLEALTACLDNAAKLPNISDLAACLYHVPFTKMAVKAHLRHYEWCHRATIGKETFAYQHFLEDYATRTKPWLSLNEEVGNIYTGSLFLSVIDLLRQSRLLPEQNISLFSYGSGCAASITCGKLASDYALWQSNCDPAGDLSNRTRVSVDEYEEIKAANASQQSSNSTLNPSDWGLKGHCLYLGNKQDVRQYSDLN
jgi:hydroxymethylglutaryl-CoA synthase